MPKITSAYCVERRRELYGDSDNIMEESGTGGGDSHIEDVSVVDVYDIASDIGKECEKIIDQFGADAVNSLMPKVINALELLENLAMRNERENITLQELKSRIALLEHDKIEKAEYRQRFEKSVFQKLYEAVHKYFKFASIDPKVLRCLVESVLAYAIANKHFS